MRKALLLSSSIIILLLTVSLYNEWRATGGKAYIGGAFTLVNTHGGEVKDTDFQGKPLIVYMGYTHCPDICPMTLTTMSAALRTLGDDADRVSMIFITLDPERDTPQALGNYLVNFDSRIVGLTGSKEAIVNVVKSYKAYASKTAQTGPDSYQVDHTGFLYLMDAQGKYVTHFDADVKPETLSKALKDNF